MSETQPRQTLISILIRLLGRIGLGNIILFGLLCLVMFSVAAGLQDIVLGLRDAALIPITLLALLTGWWLARSRSPGWIAGIGATFLGCVVVLNQTAGLLPKLIIVMRYAFQLTWQAVSILWANLVIKVTNNYPSTEIATLDDIDSSLLGLIMRDLINSLEDITARLEIWLIGLSRGNAAFDSTVVLVLWGLAMWAVAVWAVWFVRRRNQPLLGITPAGVLFAACLSFLGESGLLMVPVLTGALLLMAARQFLRQEKRWQIEGIDYAEDIQFDQIQWSGAMVVGVIVLAMMISYVSPHKIFNSLRELVQERSQEAVQVGESLGLEARLSTPVPQGEPDPGILPRQHLLGGGPELSQRIVMLVQVEGQPEIKGLPDTTPTYYWRGLVYDIYTGHGWGTSETRPISYRAGEPAFLTVPADYYRIRQLYHLLDLPADTLYHTGLLLTADLDFRVELLPASEMENDYFAVIPLQKPSGNIYRVDSLIQQPGLRQLMAVVPDSPSGVGYPQWITDRYLQLPPSLPADLVRLAIELTERYRTPYEKASAIESYLRQFAYTLDVPQPPADRDVVEYFLFDLKRGYCDYYATAMVVLARSVGLPARLVTGYASGSYDTRIERFVVTANDAHSWVEIYFPGLGWVEFEPTGGRQLIDRPEEILPRLEVELGDILPKNARTFWRTGWRWIRWGGVLFAGSGLLAYLIIILDAWWLSHMAPQRALRIFYQRMRRHARRMDIDLAPGETPHEFAIEFSRRVTCLSSKPNWQKELAPTSQESYQLVDIYALSIYGPQKAMKADQEQALQTWRRLTRRLWLARGLAWFSSLRKRLHLK